MDSLPTRLIPYDVISKIDLTIRGRGVSRSAGHRGGCSRILGVDLQNRCFQWYLRNACSEDSGELALSKSWNPRDGISAVDLSTWTLLNDEQDLTSVVEICRKLRVLNCSNQPGLSVKALVSFANALRSIHGKDGTSLRHLCLNGSAIRCKTHEFEAALSIIAVSLAKSLLSLELQATHVGDRALVIIAGRCRRLRHLDISRCTNVTDAGVAAVVRGACQHRLATLIAPRCPRLTGDWFLRSYQDSALVHPAALTHVDLSYCREVTDSAAHVLVTTCSTSLVTLLLAGCVKVTDVTGHLVFTQLQRLRRVSFADCPLITDITSNCARSELLQSVDFRRSQVSAHSVILLLGSLPQVVELCFEASPIPTAKPKPWAKHACLRRANRHRENDEHEREDYPVVSQKLAKLHLRDVKGVPERLLENVLVHCSCLEALDISGCLDRLNTGLIKSALANCSRLQELYIANWCDLTDDTVKMMRSSHTLQSLRVLDISCALDDQDSLSSDALMELLDACNNLRELYLQRRRSFDESCAALLGIRIEVLDVTGCQRMSFGALRTTVARCPELRRICLGHCPQLRHQDLAFFTAFLISDEPELMLNRTKDLTPSILRSIACRKYREKNAARCIQRAWHHRPPLTREQRLAIARSVTIIQRAARRALLRLRVRYYAVLLRSIRVIQAAVRLWRLDCWLHRLTADGSGTAEEAATVVSKATRRFLWRLSPEGRQCKALMRVAKAKLVHLKDRRRFLDCFTGSVLPEIVPAARSTRQRKNMFISKEVVRCHPPEFNGVEAIDRVLTREKRIILARKQVLAQIEAEGDRRLAESRAAMQKKSMQRMMLFNCTISMLQRVYRRRKRRRQAMFSPASRSLDEPWRLEAWKHLQAAIRGRQARILVARVRSGFPGERVVTSKKAEAMRFAARDALVAFHAKRLKEQASQLSRYRSTKRKANTSKSSQVAAQLSEISGALEGTRKSLEAKCAELAAKDGIEADPTKRKVQDLHEARLLHVSLDRATQELSTVRMLEAMMRAISGDQEEVRKEKRCARHKAEDTRERSLAKAQRKLIETRTTLEERRLLLQSNDVDVVRRRYNESTCAMLRTLSEDDKVEIVRQVELKWIEERLRMEVMPALEASLMTSVSLIEYGLTHEAMEGDWCASKHQMVECFTLELPKLNALSAELRGLLKDKCGVALKLDLAKDSALIRDLSVQLTSSIAKEGILQDKLRKSFEAVNAQFARMRVTKQATDTTRDTGMLSTPQGAYTCVLPSPLRTSQSAARVVEAVTENAWTALIPPEVYTGKKLADSQRKEAARVEQARALVAIEHEEGKPKKKTLCDEEDTGCAPVRAPVYKRQHGIPVGLKKLSLKARYREWRERDAMETELMKACILNRQKLRTGLGEGIQDILITVGEAEAERMARIQAEKAERGKNVFTRIHRNLGMHESVYFWVTKTLVPDHMITDIRLIRTATPDKEALALADNGYRKVSHHKLQGALRNRFELWVSNTTRHEQIVDIKISYDKPHEKVFAHERFRRLTAKRKCALLVPGSKIWVKRGIQPAQAVDITNLQRREAHLLAALKEHPGSVDINELLHRCQIQLEEAKALPKQLPLAIRLILRRSSWRCYRRS